MRDNFRAKKIRNNTKGLRVSESDSNISGSSNAIQYAMEIYKTICIYIKKDSKGM